MNARIQNRIATTLGLAVLLLFGGLQLFAAETLLGKTAPEWQMTNWMNSAPMQLSDLRGKVVLVRWWTAPDCPYCRATAPALNEFYDRYRADGLEVIGFYHHKSPEPLQLASVRKYAANFGFKFPLAVDPDWKTLHQWWLDSGQRNFTSVSFLIDRHGIVRHIHPGGEYVKGDADYAAMEAAIKKLLAEK